MALLIAPWSAA